MPDNLSEPSVESGFRANSPLIAKPENRMMIQVQRPFKVARKTLLIEAPDIGFFSDICRTNNAIFLQYSKVCHEHLS